MWARSHLYQFMSSTFIHSVPHTHTHTHTPHTPHTHTCLSLSHICFLLCLRAFRNHFQWCQHNLCHQAFVAFWLADTTGCSQAMCACFRLFILLAYTREDGQGLDCYVRTPIYTWYSNILVKHLKFKTWLIYACSADPDGGTPAWFPSNPLLVGELSFDILVLVC